MRDYAWQGEDDPGRLDTATVIFGPDRLQAHGTSRTDWYALSWVLETGDDWVTRRLAATVHGHGWSRQLELELSDDGAWSSRASASGSGASGGVRSEEGGLAVAAMPPPGIDNPDELRDALDCDLGLCPMTNTMPILRLNLLGQGMRGQGASEGETMLTMAWVEVPSLRVFPSRQRYSSSLASVGTVRFSSESRDFTAELTTDQHGVVTLYPGLARLLPLPHVKRG
ncbi:putative glycolipid-binding domain-containing protein [Arthrobacter sp. CDRTa11]|nr:putative glycolipid-binding domain-containing protein [Arthrobacter sp. CDRTa11]